MPFRDTTRLLCSAQTTRGIDNTERGALSQKGSPYRGAVPLSHGCTQDTLRRAAPSRPQRVTLKSNDLNKIVRTGKGGAILQIREHQTSVKIKIKKSQLRTRFHIHWKIVSWIVDTKRVSFETDASYLVYFQSRLGGRGNEGKEGERRKGGRRNWGHERWKLGGMGTKSWRKSGGSGRKESEEKEESRDKIKDLDSERGTRGLILERIWGCWAIYLQDAAAIGKEARQQFEINTAVFGSPNFSC